MQFCILLGFRETTNSTSHILEEQMNLKIIYPPLQSSLYKNICEDFLCALRGDMKPSVRAHVTTSLHHSYLGHLSPPLRSIHSQRRLRKTQRLERYTSYAQNLQFSCSRSKCSGINVQGSLGSCFEFYSAALVLAFGGYPAIQLHLWSTIPLLYARGLGKEEK